MASNEYDKLKEMYRLQGQEEQGRRFNEMVGMPSVEEAPAAPGPMEGLEPSPIMQASIAKDKARIAAALKREDAAVKAAYDAESGPGAYDQTNRFVPTQGGEAPTNRYHAGWYQDAETSFYARHNDVGPDSLVDLEARGLITLSPTVKAEISRIQSLRAKARDAMTASRRLEESMSAPVLRPKPGGGYEDADYRIGLAGTPGVYTAMGRRGDALDATHTIEPRMRQIPKGR